MTRKALYLISVLLFLSIVPVLLTAAGRLTFGSETMFRLFCALFVASSVAFCVPTKGYLERKTSVWMPRVIAFGITFSAMWVILFQGIASGNLNLVGKSLISLSLLGICVSSMGRVRNMSDSVAKKLAWIRLTWFSGIFCLCNTLSLGARAADIGITSIVMLLLYTTFIEPRIYSSKSE